MRALLFVLAAALAACTSTPPPESAPQADIPAGDIIDEPSFDAVAWTAAVEATDDPAALVALSGELLDAVDWRTACGEDDPTALRRGVAMIHRLAGGAELAEITCQAFAYQSAFALVDARAGRPPRLIRARLVEEDGAPSENTTESFFGTMGVGDATGTFRVFTKSAGHGGCGVAADYRLQPDGSAEIVRTAAHPDCSDPLAPEAWPVVYTAE